MTATHYINESESAVAFDQAVDSTGLFTIFREVPGTLLQPRPGQIDKGVRIDRILWPNTDLMGRGWRHGCIGVELKRSGVKVGPAIAQAMDYSRSSFTLPGGVQVVLGLVFLWPVEKQHGPLASILSQGRLGTAEADHWSALKLMSGEATVLHVSHTGEIRVGTSTAGSKVGSR